MPERHYRAYVAYYREQPFGLWREDFRFAYLLSVVAAMLGGKGQTPGDFMPFYRLPEQEAPCHGTAAIHEVFSRVHVVRA